MKRNIALNTAAFFFYLILVSGAAPNFQNRINKNNFASPIDGAWQRVYSFDGKIASTGEPKEMAILYDGFFSSVGQDSTGKWTNTHAGVYEVSGNTFKATVRYSSHAERMGSTQWIDYTLNGDTLTMKWFKKLVNAQGQDITAQMPKNSESKYIKAKK